MHRGKLSSALRTLLVSTMGFLAACGGDGPALDPSEANFDTFSGGPAGGVAVVLVDGEPDDLNPITYSSNPAYQAIHLMFRALARRDSTLSGHQPDLATSWEVEGDTLVVLKLRPDARWHDGRPVTADDVAFTIERQRDPTVASPRVADVAAVQAVAVVDSVTVNVRLSRAGQYTVNALLEVVPVPRHLLEGADPAQLRLDPFGRNPVGNGFFRFGRWEPGQQLVLEANPDMPEGRPALDRIVIRVVPDINASLTELLSGEADLLKITPDHRDRLEASDVADLHTAPQVRPTWIAWNTQRAPTDDVRVRRAILMAIDREALTAGLFGSLAEPAFSPIPPTLAEHSDEVTPIAFDRAAAGRLLDEAGWRDSNGDGIRDRAGAPLRIEVDYISADPTRQDVLVAIQAMVRQVGVDLVPRAYERTAWVERLRSREFAGSSWGWGWGPGVVGPNAEAVFHSRSIPPAGANFAGFANPRADELIDTLLATRDQVHHRQLWPAFEQLIIDEVPYAPLYLDPELFGVNSRFENVEFRGIEWWEDIPYWYVPLERRIGRDRMGG